MESLRRLADRRARDAKLQEKNKAAKQEKAAERIFGVWEVLELSAEGGEDSRGRFECKALSSLVHVVSESRV